VLLNKCSLIFGKEFFPDKEIDYLIFYNRFHHLAHSARESDGTIIICVRSFAFLNNGIINAESQTGGIKLCSKHNAKSSDKG
jgi:hypothetical protein